MLVAPLPDTSALVVFRDLGAEADGIDRLAPDRARAAAARRPRLRAAPLPAEAAVQKLAAAIPAAPVAGRLPGARRRRWPGSRTGSPAHASCAPSPSAPRDRPAARARRGARRPRPDARLPARRRRLAARPAPRRPRPRPRRRRPRPPGAGVTLDLATADGRRRLTARAAADPGARPNAEGIGRGAGAPRGRGRRRQPEARRRRRRRHPHRRPPAPAAPTTPPGTSPAAPDPRSGGARRFAGAVAARTRRRQPRTAATLTPRCATGNPLPHTRARNRARPPRPAPNERLD